MPAVYKNSINTVYDVGPEVSFFMEVGSLKQSAVYECFPLIPPDAWKVVSCFRSMMVTFLVQTKPNCVIFILICDSRTSRLSILVKSSFHDLLLLTSINYSIIHTDLVTDKLARPTFFSEVAPITLRKLSVLPSIMFHWHL